jgi:hypothetical protein
MSSLPVFSLTQIEQLHLRNSSFLSLALLIVCNMFQGLSWRFETVGANHYSESSKFKGATKDYIVKVPKSAGARHYCPKIPQVPGTLGTRANLSLVSLQ